MGNETLNYKLPKPEEDDFYDIAEFNKAMDILDETLTDMENKKLDRDGDASDTKINSLDTITSEFPVPAAGEPAKTFLGKVKKFIEDTNGRYLEADMTIFVATTGSDTTGNGSSTAPYATINKALRVIPKQLEARTVTISIADGTYFENVSIKGFTTGNLFITGNITNPGNVQISLSGGMFEILHCTAQISIQGINFVKVASSITFQNLVSANHCNNVWINHCSITGFETDDNGIVIIASNVQVSYVTFNNLVRCVYIWDEIGIVGTVSSTLKIGSCYGSNNTYYCVVPAGTVYLIDRIQPSTIYGNVIENGGIFVKSSGAVIGSLQGDVAYYVANTGSDTTGDGSQANPFKTIQHTLDTLPKDLNSHECTIQVADGIYNEALVIMGFHSGALRLYSTHTLEISDSCRISNILCSENSAYVFITGFNITTTTKTGIASYNNRAIIIDYCKIAENATNQIGMYFAESDFQVFHSVVSYRNVALHAYKSYGVSAWWGTTSGNITGMYSMLGSIIKTVGVQPTAITLRVQATGGSFSYENGTQIIGPITAGLSCTWGIIRGGYIRHGNLNGTAMITVELNVHCTVQLSAGTQYTVYGFPATSTGYDLPVAVNRPHIMDHCFMGWNGQLHFTPLENVIISSDMLFNCTYLTNA